MYEILNETPAIKILLPAVCGIILFDVVQFPTTFLWISIPLFFILSVILHQSRFVYDPSAILLKNLSAGILIILFFISIRSSLDHKNHSTYFHNKISSGVRYSGVVKTIKNTPNTTSLIVKIQSVELPGKITIYACGNLSVYINVGNSTIQRGDIFISNEAVSGISPRRNPSGFDFKNYMAKQNVHVSSYIKSDNYSILPGKGLWALFFKIADHLSELGSQTLDLHLSDKTIGVAESLLLGNRSSLDKSTSAIFSNTGSMHVLAVSGLHVGMIYLILNLMFKKLRTGRWRSMFITLLTIASIFTYAFVTGLSPSVVRASVMFSIIEIAGLRRLDSNILNSVAFSALLMLLSDPMYIYNVGFQLSYSAVLGIILLYKPIRDTIDPSNSFLAKLWDITAISICAQISTFPITLYYFNQFPTYFLASNLVVIPAATVIIPLGVILFLCDPLPHISDYLGIVLEIILDAMITALSYLNNLPYSTIDNISITFPQVLLLYAFVIFIYLSCFSRYHFKPLFVGLVIFLVLSLLEFHENLRLRNKSALVIYRLPKQTSIDYHIGGKLIHIYGEETQSDEIQNPYRAKNDLQLVKEVRIGRNAIYSIIELNDRKIIIINKELPENALTDEYKLVLIRNNSVRNINKLLQRLKFNKVVSDATNTYFYDQKVNDSCRIKGIEYVSILKEGGRVMN